MNTRPDETTPEGRRELFEIEIEKCKEILGDIFKEYISIWDKKDKEDEKMPEKDFLGRHHDTLERISKILINADMLLKDQHDWNMRVMREIAGLNNELVKWKKREIVHELSRWGRGNHFSILSLKLCLMDECLSRLVEKINEPTVTHDPSNANRLELACERIVQLMMRKNIAMRLYDRGRFEVLTYILQSIIKKVPKFVYESIQVPNPNGESYNRVQSLTDEVFTTDPITDHSVQYSEVIIKDLQDLIVEVILALNKNPTQGETEG